jgi:hypothetical protein
MNQQKPSRPRSITAVLSLQKKTILLIVVVAVITLAVSGAVSIMLNRNSIISLPSIANIRAVGVRAYWDPNLQNQTTRIDWGTVYLGSSNNASLYLQSTSNVQTTLVLTTTNWTLINKNNAIVSGPADTTPHMNLTWNYNDQTLNPGQIFQTTLTLVADSSLDFVKFLIDNNVKQFTMDITIQANEK